MENAMRDFIRRENVVRTAKSGVGPVGLILTHHKLCAEHPETSTLIHDPDIELEQRELPVKVGNEYAFKQMLQAVQEPGSLKIRVQENGAILIAAGQFKARLNGLPLEGYRPDIKITPEHQPVEPAFGKALIELIGQAATYVGTGPTARDLGFIYILERQIFATNGTVLFRAKLPQKCPAKMTLLPAAAEKLVHTWQHREIQGMYVSGRSILVKSDGIWGETVLCDKAAPTQIVSALSGQHTRLALVNRDELRGAVNRILAACPGLHGVSRVEFDWQDGMLRLQSSSEHSHDSAEDFCPAELLDSPEALKKPINGYYVKAALDSLQTPQLILGVAPIGPHNLTLLNDSATMAITIACMR